MKILNNSERQELQLFSKCSYHFGLSRYFNLNLYGKGKVSQENGTIYIATNLINGKQYVGQTVRKLNERKNGHYYKGYCLHHSIKKYGIENFKWIYFSCPEKDLDWTETLLIKNLNSLTPNGYNLTTGGNKDKHLTEETKQKIKEKRIGQHPSEVTKELWSQQRKGKNHHMFGKHQKETTKEKIREKAKERYKNKENHPMFGKHHKNSPLVGRKRPIQSQKMKEYWANKNNK